MRIVRSAGELDEALAAAAREARDPLLGRSVAFKAVRTGGGSPVIREERLLREAEGLLHRREGLACSPRLRQLDAEVLDGSGLDVGGPGRMAHEDARPARRVSSAPT